MKKIYLSKLACAPLIEYLKSNDFELHFIDGKGSPVYKEIATHADIYMCQLGLWENSWLFTGNIHKLANNYPGNIIYNAICTGKYFLHNLKYTDSELLSATDTWHSEMYNNLHRGMCREIHSDMYKEMHYDIDSPLYTPLIKINVNQGYTRCTCLPINDRSFITADEGIAKALASCDADVLLIEKGHVKLPGFDYGFIGGCAGNILVPAQDYGCAGGVLVSGQDCCSAHEEKTENALYYKRTIVFNGDLETHPDYKKIAAFIKDRDIDLVYFRDHPLEDIGSILMTFMAPLKK